MWTDTEGNDVVLASAADEWHRRHDEAQVRAEELRQALVDYADHQSWRCGHPDRYPWEPECPCGLTAVLRRFNIEVKS